MELRYYLNTILTKGQIRRSILIARVSILFKPKKNKCYYLYIDYSGLNIVIVKNYYLLSLINKILDYLYRSNVFIKLDLKNTYYRI